MKSLSIKSVRKIAQNKHELEEKLNVNISIMGGVVELSGNADDEHFAVKVIQALDFQFLIEDALLLLREDYMLCILNIKDYTNRNDLNVIRSRLIGTKGKTLKVLESLCDCFFAVKENKVAIIGPCGKMQEAEQAIISLIQGAKQANVYTRLEKLRKAERMMR
ncbi:MAG: hypothetical protein WC533_02820 [Candidatus Pacearchaeota archaeon]